MLHVALRHTARHLPVQSEASDSLLAWPQGPRRLACSSGCRVSCFGRPAQAAHFPPAASVHVSSSDADTHASLLRELAKRADAEMQPLPVKRRLLVAHFADADARTPAAAEDAGTSAGAAVAIAGRMAQLRKAMGPNELLVVLTGRAQLHAWHALLQRKKSELGSAWAASAANESALEKAAEVARGCVCYLSV
jgi:hypothetical protein